MHCSVLISWHRNGPELQIREWRSQGRQQSEKRGRGSQVVMLQKLRKVQLPQAEEQSGNIGSPHCKKQCRETASWETDCDG